MRALRVAAAALPMLLAARPLDPDAARPPAGAPPPARALDVWMADGAVRFDAAFAARAERERVQNAWRQPARAEPPSSSQAAPATTLGDGFVMVGSVAVLRADPERGEITPAGRIFGMNYENLAAVSRRFVAAFGDDYDQIAMFLAFTDQQSPAALAYEMPVKNDVRGLGLDLFDRADFFGSAGRLKAVLNMKRILAYGRDSASQPQNTLYPVWSQEAAHRWLVYFKVATEAGDVPADVLLGRDGVHWSNLVDSDASTMDGVNWEDNGDGTFTPTERFERYGALDQYAMGLRTADEVPPFFALADVTNATSGLPVGKTGYFTLGARHNARRIDLTVADIQRAVGPRDPVFDASARDLRMGVVLVVPPNRTARDTVGESFRIDRVRALWDAFYNNAVGGRGQVCTSLLRPCRGDVVAFGEARAADRAGGAEPPDGVVAPGERFVLNVPLYGTGTETWDGPVVVEAPAGIALGAQEARPGAVEPAGHGLATFEGTMDAQAPCGAEFLFGLSAPGRLGASRDVARLVLGLAPGPTDDLEGDVGGWRVNPDGTDTATLGVWEAAHPEPTVAFDFVLQPGDAWSGRRAFVTGAAAGPDPSAFDVDGGRTTLESPPFPLAGLRAPRLSYRVYFVNADYVGGVLQPGTEDTLIVQASADGARWTEVDRLDDMGMGWRRRLVRLDEKLPAEDLAAPSLRFRFVAEDSGVAENIVEAAIDDVGLAGEAASCGQGPPPDAGADGRAALSGGGGCACAAARASTSTSINEGLGGFVFLLAALGASMRRSR